MPNEQGYERRLAPIAPVATPLRNPQEEVASAIGGGLERLGDTMHQAEIRAFSIERKLNADREAADVANRFATFRLQVDQQAVDARNSAPPGGAGHVDAVSQAFDKAAEGLTSGITEQETANRIRNQLAEYRAQVVAREYGWSQGAATEKLVTDTQLSSETAANRVRTAAGTSTTDGRLQIWADELKFGDDTISALPVPADVREKLRRAHDQLVTLGLLNGLNDTDPNAAHKLIDKGLFDTILTPEQRDRAREGAMVEVRRGEAQLAHQQALERHAFNDQVQSVETLLNSGVEVPATQIAQLARQAQQYGDQSTATRLAILGAKRDLRRQTEPWTPQQIDGAIAELAGKPKRSASEDIRLTALRELRPSIVDRYTNRPGEWAAVNGMAPPPINFADPATIAARRSWANTVAQRTGRPVGVLIPSEVNDLRERLTAGGAQARVQVADALAGFGGRQSYQAAQQVAPDDPVLARMAMLPDHGTRVQVQRGAEIRKARPDLIDGQNGKLAREHFDAAIGRAAHLFGGADRGAILETARNLYAAQVDDTDFAGPSFDNALHAALGGSWRNGRAVGGIGSYGRTPVMLPPSMSDQEFDAAMAKLNSAKAFATQNRPIWGNGQPMTGAELARFHPVLRPDGYYQFENDRGEVVGNKGGTFLLDITKLARAAR